MAAQHPNGSEILRAADNLEFLASTIRTLIDEAESFVDGTEYAHDARRGWVRLLREALGSSQIDATWRGLTLDDTIDIMRETAQDWN